MGRPLRQVSRLRSAGRRRADRRRNQFAASLEVTKRGGIECLTGMGRASHSLARQLAIGLILLEYGMAVSIDAVRGTVFRRCFDSFLYGFGRLVEIARFGVSGDEFADHTRTLLTG